MASNPSPAPSPSHTEALPASVEAEIFWAKNKGKIIAAVVILIVGLVLFGVYQFNTAMQQQAAAAALANAKTPEQLRAVITDHPNTWVAGNARILLAEQLATDKKWDEAATEYETFVRDQPTHPLAPTGLLGVASIRDQQNKLDDAIAAYQKLRSQYKDSYAVPFAMLSEAKALARQGKVAESKQLLEQMAASYPASAFTMEANNELEVPLTSEEIVFAAATPAPSPAPSAAPAPGATPSLSLEAPAPGASPALELSPGATPAPAQLPVLPESTPAPAASPAVP